MNFHSFDLGSTCKCSMHMYIHRNCWDIENLWELIVNCSSLRVFPLQVIIMPIRRSAAAPPKEDTPPAPESGMNSTFAMF